MHRSICIKIVPFTFNFLPTCNHNTRFIKVICIIKNYPFWSCLVRWTFSSIKVPVWTTLNKTVCTSIPYSIFIHPIPIFITRFILRTICNIWILYKFIWFNIIIFLSRIIIIPYIKSIIYFRTNFTSTTYWYRIIKWYCYGISWITSFINLASHIF